MNKTHGPLGKTLFFGFFCGLSSIPLCLALSLIVSTSTAICALYWLFTAVYAYLLSRWSGKAPATCLFPIMLLFGAIFLMKGTIAFVLFSLIVISWIRSGICYRKPVVRALMTETLLGFMGGILLSVFEPQSTLGWSLGIWLFFLVQAVYFVLNEDAVTAQGVGIDTDPFERASRQAEAILEIEETVLYSKKKF